MKLSVGIVGLPNVGKSTLFNAITNSNISAENYPFCTIEPNKGIIPVPDDRLAVLAKISNSEKIVPAVIEFTDIAGLVKGASKGEGLGNKFLAHIREVSVITEVIRCFEDANVTHVNGNIDPLLDLETIELELIYADYETIDKLVDNQQKRIKTNQKDEVEKLNLLLKIKAHLAENKAVRELALNEDEKKLIKEYHFLTAKPIIFVANLSENELTNPPQSYLKLAEYAKDKQIPIIAICAKLEAELSLLSPEEKQEYLKELGIDEPGLDKLTKTAFKRLGLETFLTTGPKETRAWTIYQGDTAPKAAGVIHTDFEKGFIRANVISYQDFVACNGLKTAKEKGLIRQEGKDYIMQEGDVVEFLFNV